MQKVKIYSDGSARGNGKENAKGGYGTIVIYLDDNEKEKKREEFAEGFLATTNNRMEILGAIIGIESLTTPCEIDLYSDSSYLINAFNSGWLTNWQKNNWKNSMNKPVKNKELWERILLALKPHKCNFNWVKGHSSNEFNNRCDYLATSFADGIGLVKVNGIYELPKPDDNGK